ncbi:MAG: hypothetical protein COC06_06530 [Bacteroidales bacterium]|nr:MAG: hypothetical protein COC06_06530 [Bacteroidales bacterium]
MLISLILSIDNCKAQKYIENIQTVLDSISETQIPELNSEVNISVNKVNVTELLRALANDVNLNLSVPVNSTVLVSNNFSNVKAKDVILFLCKEYGFTLEVFGKIIKLHQPPLVPEEIEPLNIHFNTNTKLLSYDLNEALIEEVSREITKQTGKNIVLSPGLTKQMLSGFVQDMSVEKAMEQLAFSNNLKVKQVDESLFVVEPKLPTKEPVGNYQAQASNLKLQLEKGASVEVENENSISINVDNYPLEKLFLYVAQQLNKKFVLFDPLKGKVSLHVKNISWNEFLFQTFKNSESVYKFQGDFCFAGARKSAGLKTSQVIQLQFRSVDKLKDLFPAQEIKDLEIKEFPELNSLIVMGDADRIYEFNEFIKQIDRSIPVILIDVIILEVSDTRGVATGLEAGLSKESVTTGGTVLPGIDMTLSSSSVNNLLGDLGLTKLGKVSPNFYLKLKALETEGKVDIRSTPRLSTLNGHEATLVIGETEYYKEERNDYLGTQNPQLSSQTLYKPVDAELKVVIKPFVAGDGNITLEIDVNQSDFTERISEFAPPGKVSRQFKSMIRIGNGETILLGGLEEKRKSKISRGIPFLSRIPILKWFFSSRSEEDSKTKLNILIKPTIIG